MMDWKLFVPDTMTPPEIQENNGEISLRFNDDCGAAFLEKRFDLPGRYVKIRVESDAAPVLNNRAGAVVNFMRDEKYSLWTLYLDPVPGPDGKLAFEGTFDAENAAYCVLSLYAKWFAGNIRFRSVTLTAAEPIPVRHARIVTTRIWPEPPTDCDRNRRIIQNMLDKVAAEVEHPDLVLFSECLPDRFDPRPPAERAEPLTGPTFQLLSAWSRTHRCYTAISIHELENGHLYNTAFIVDREGKLAGSYRKCHLTWGESRNGILPGKGFPVFQLDFGKVGMEICWDNWFGESARSLRLNGAELVLLPIAGDGLVSHRDHVWAARALENGVYLVSSTTFASRDGVAASRIYDPNGEIMAQTAEPGRYAVADITFPFRNPSRYLSVGDSATDPRSIYIRERNVEAEQRVKDF